MKRGILERHQSGLILVELVAVVGILAILLALGSSVYKGLRLTSQAVTAQNNLRQVGVGMELYFLKHHAFPPNGSNLVAELTPFVGDPGVFSNPLKDEVAPGETVNALYVAPTLGQIDRPNIYVTAMVSDDGTTAVFLKTGGLVERRDGLRLPADDLSQTSTAIALLWGQTTPYWTPTPPPLPPAPPAPPEPPPTLGGGFEVLPGGDVVTKTCSDVTVKVLGSQFGYADGTLVDIVVAADIASGMTPLFNNQPVQGGETYSLTSVKAGTRVTIKGEIAGTYERWLWTKYGYPLSYTSNDGSGQVIVLRNGDSPINNNPAYPCQVGVGNLLAPYVKSGKVSIADNQALYCFDFNPLRTRTGIDYNDLVILATATAAERPCEDEPAPVTPTTTQQPEQGHKIAVTVNLNPSNNTDFEFELVKPDGSKITRDNLLASMGNLQYEGKATSVRFRPKGNGNQNGIYLDGKLQPVVNGTAYTITGQIDAHVYNAKTASSGRAMGRWWMTLNATGATMTSNR